MAKRGAALDFDVEVLDGALSPKRRGVLWIVEFLSLALGVLPFLVWKGNPAVSFAPHFFVLQGLVTFLWMRKLALPVPTFRASKVRLEEGALRIGKRRIRARDVTGASTAILQDDVHEVALAVRGRLRPILLRVPSREALSAIHDMLGVGQRDANMLAWRAGVSPWALGALSFIGIALQLWSLSRVWSNELTHLFAVVFFFGAVIAATSLLGFLLRHPLFDTLRQRHRVTLSRAGVHVVGAYDGETERNVLGAFIPYGEIGDIELSGSTLAVQRVGRTSVPLVLTIHDRTEMSQEELAHVAAQIRTAVARNKGPNEPAGTIEGELALLDKRSDTATWLGQLSSLEQSQGQGYRGTLVDREAMLRAVANPDTAPAVRFAAARLLRQDPDARVRVKEAAEHARFDKEKRMLRIALRDEVEPESVDAVLTEVEESAERYRRGDT